MPRPAFLSSLSGDQSLEERRSMLNKLFQLTSCMLYVTPEMFFGRTCQDAISELRIKKRLSRFVVDEAHCILEVCGPLLSVLVNSF
jgi:superfamily II DNA helicase RecQ